MHKILVIGDSLSMARLDSGIGFEETYAYLLQIKLKDSIVINASVRANNSENTLSENYSYETLDAVKPDLVIIFLGIVDCMPRLFSRNERLLLRFLMAIKFLKGLGKLIIAYRSKRRYELTKRRLIQFVSLENWNVNLEKILLKADGKVIFINIPFPGPQLLSRNYQIEEIVNNYNTCLSDQAKKHGAKVVDFYNITKEYPHLLLEDGYHITIEAHKILTEKLLESIKIFMKKNT